MTASHHVPITGALLVGGASRRFGSPKALATLAGQTLAERSWSALSWCDERIAVGKATDALSLSFPVADDGSDVRAPLAGVVASLRLATNDIVVVLPVDCPQITQESLRRLAAACDDAAVPQTGPLPGAYHRRALGLLEEHLTSGRLALHAALTALAVRVVPLPPAELANVNTRGDLKRLQELIGNEGATAAYPPM
jgi:molybdopterin-guanine dinucleotide biosynthesis protein A